MSYVLEAIGVVRGGRDQPVDDDWGQSRARIELDPARFGPEALAGLADFSHLEVIFLFDRVTDAEIEYGARHPRGRADWPLVGIFAQRGKNRPNRLGLCACKIVRVDGRVVEVEGLDAIDGTPVMDLKPAMREFLPRGDVVEPAWAVELMKDYW
jgi:tRNA-Thr(GGU) m(6)t(6)A37 methyltransferase TsaA